MQALHSSPFRALRLISNTGSRDLRLKQFPTSTSQNLLFEISIRIREKRLSPRRAPRRSLLPLSPKRTHGRPSVQECRLRLKRPPPNASRRYPPFKSSTAFRALAPTASFRGPLCFASLSAKKYGTPYFSARNRTSKYS